MDEKLVRGTSGACIGWSDEIRRARMDGVVYLGSSDELSAAERGINSCDARDVVGRRLELRRFADPGA
jgi:hypothetical protein